MSGAQPPSVPLFIAGTPGADMPAAMNGWVRDPLTFLLSPPAVLLSRANAWNVAENRHQAIPWDTAGEDTYGMWTSPSASGASTTLNGATAAGATSVTLTSGTGFAIGDYVKIDTGANAEYRTISAVAGAVITVPALALAHSSGVAAVEQTSNPGNIVIGAPGWYDAELLVTLSGTGAANLSLMPSIAVNGASHTGVSGGAGWEGSAHGLPTGVSSQPKAASFFAPIYASLGDIVTADLFFSTESAITAADVTAGWQCRLSLIWAGL